MIFGSVFLSNRKQIISLYCHIYRRIDQKIRFGPIKRRAFRLAGLLAIGPRLVSLPTASTVPLEDNQSPQLHISLPGEGTINRAGVPQPGDISPLTCRSF